LDDLGYRGSQTSSQENELPFGAKGESLPTFLLRSGRVLKGGNPTLALAAFGSNGTHGQWFVGLVRGTASTVFVFAAAKNAPALKITAVFGFVPHWWFFGCEAEEREQ
jgi:hypothetical protein